MGISDLLVSSRRVCASRSGSFSRRRRSCRGRRRNSDRKSRGLSGPRHGHISGRKSRRCHPGRKHRRCHPGRKHRRRHPGGGHRPRHRRDAHSGGGSSSSCGMGRERHGASKGGKDHRRGAAMSVCVYGKGSSRRGRRSSGGLRGSHGGGGSGLGRGQGSAAGGTRGCVLEALVVAPPDLPDEALLLQLGDALGVHGRGLALEEQLILAALALDPRGEVGVGLVAGRDEGVAVLGPVLAQFDDLLLPGGVVAVPDESLQLEDVGPLRGHGRRLPVVHELVLAALALHPAGELRVGGEGVRDEAVAVRLAEFQHLRQHVVPTIFVELLEAGVGALPLARRLDVADVAVPSGGNVDGGRGDSLGGGLVHVQRGHVGGSGKLLARGRLLLVAAGSGTATATVLVRRRGTGSCRSRRRRRLCARGSTLTILLLLANARDTDEVG
mmetsp:Transcript_31397/g.92048  ORF Transcript_31397/g.92048 Transcript_31397/m.92048 type:complete len:440 (-) Transcript_31397:166-1485(-)